MTSTIKVHVVENKVVSPVTVAAEIALCLASGDDIIIDLMQEAPTIACCELQTLFDFLQARGLDLSNIEIHTGNMLEKSDQVKVVHRPDFMYELNDYQEVARQFRFETKKIDYHFGHLVSRCNLPRLLIASFLFDLYPQQVLQTFHWRHGNDYHRMYLSLEELVYLFGPNSEQARQAWQLIQHAPLLKEPEQSYPIIPYTQSDIIRACQWHKSFFVDIVCETIHDDRNFFLTEKFWRSIITRTPFILHGPQWILENVRALGFQTFGQWWDEGYSQDPGLHRITEIKKVIAHLAALPKDKIIEMYEDMETVLEHNFQNFLALDLKDLAQVKWTAEETSNGV
jgi:hypothetical protein